MIIDSTQIDKKFDNFIIGKADTIPKLHIKKKIDHYYWNYNKRLRALPPKFLTDLQKKNNQESNWTIKEKVFVSRKYDGQAGFLIYDLIDEGYKCYFCNATSHLTYLGHQANSEAEALFEEHNVQTAIIAGELFMGAIDEKQTMDFTARSHIYELVKLIKDPEGYKRLGFRAFDIIELNGEDWLSKNFHERETKLREIFPSAGRIAHVHNILIDKTQLADYYDQVVKNGGAEGIVIRDPIDYPNYKIKPINTLDAVIIGAVSGRPGSRIQQNQLGSSLVALRYEDGSYQVLGRVGGGLTDEDRSDLWQKMKFVRSSYVAASSDGRAYQMVEPHHVATIEYLDIYTQSSDGTPKLQPCLSYDALRKEWKMIRTLPFVSLISPRFIKEQPLHADKQPATSEQPIIQDVRVDQITSLVNLDKITQVSPMNLEKSSILARFIFSNKEKVKKFVMWKTNKHKDDPRFPRYVIFFADFSSSRRDPLKRSVKTTNDEYTCYQLLGDWIIEELQNNKGTDLKRGWQFYKKPKYEDEFKFHITYPHGFQKRTKEEYKMIKWKKIYAQFKGISIFLTNLSRKYNIVFDPPYESLDHALILFKQKHFEEFFDTLQGFNKKAWNVHLPEIEEQNEREKYEKIIQVFEKYTKSDIQEKLITNLT